MMNRDLVKESGDYDNYIDTEARKGDKYSVSLDRFFDEPIPVALQDNSKANRVVRSSVWKEIYVHFRTKDDMAAFCTAVNQFFPGDMKEAYYPLHDTSLSLFKDEDDSPVVFDADKLIPTRGGISNGPLDVPSAYTLNWMAHWKDMPNFVQNEKIKFRVITLKFRTEECYAKFCAKIPQSITEKTKSMWYPEQKVIKNLLLRWIQPEGRTLPKHPMYIVSKGRSESMITSRVLSRMQIPHNIVIEPQDLEPYEKALDTFSIRDYVTLLVAPFSNHGDGPGRARNWAWDHSISMGATSHWVLDDNIGDFHRLHNNSRVRFESGVGFQVMEDFVERYSNVYIAGPQYRFFIDPSQQYAPYVANTRIYSTLLIRNDCKHRWRGRYNEDTDICLRVMKDGDVCVQFNSFLQAKCATQTVAGGNTSEFYHAENADSEGFKETGYNTEGTVNKSQMLVDMHPDVARLVWRYGRWHHHVDYTPFKVNKLKFRDGFEPSADAEPNEYGMKYVEDFDWKNA